MTEIRPQSLRERPDVVVEQALEFLARPRLSRRRTACLPSYISTGARTVVMTPYICHLLIVLGLAALVDLLKAG
jgi:hypothetical protein